MQAPMMMQLITLDNKKMQLWPQLSQSSSTSVREFTKVAQIGLVMLLCEDDEHLLLVQMPPFQASPIFVSPLPSTIANEHHPNLTHPFLVLTHSPLKLTHLYNIDSTIKKTSLVLCETKKYKAKPKKNNDEKNCPTQCETNQNNIRQNLLQNKMDARVPIPCRSRA